MFFLDLVEARAGARRAATCARSSRARRETYDAELRRRHVPRVMLSDGTEPEAATLRGGRRDGALVGTPASAGAVTGVARVILDPVGAHLEPGEILVAPSTDPGWTPLFLTAGGLVMEMGGANSHGAVVAREYGIPAVVGVPHATAASPPASASPSTAVEARSARTDASRDAPPDAERARLGRLAALLERNRRPCAITAPAIGRSKPRHSHGYQGGVNTPPGPAR